MADERDELTPAQQVLGAAIGLNEAVYDLMSSAQVPDMMQRILDAHAASTDPDDEPPFAEAFDKIAQGICDLFHAAGNPAALERLADAAERWVRGED